MQMEVILKNEAVLRIYEPDLSLYDYLLLSLLTEVLEASPKSILL